MCVLLALSECSATVFIKWRCCNVIKLEGRSQVSEMLIDAVSLHKCQQALLSVR